MQELRSARLLSVVVALFGLGWLCACVAPRFAFDWPLEWMEGACLEHALRLWRGQPVYAAPSGEFIPFVYPPLAYLPMALSAALFGPTLWAARLPSLLAGIAALGCMARAGARLTGHWSGGALASGLLALGYGYCGGFADVARVDPLFMALLLLGIERVTAGRLIAALCWFALSCLAKQHGLLFLAAGSFYAMRERVARPQHVAAVWGVLLMAALLIEWRSAGWFSVYTLSVPHRHGLAPALLASFVGIDLMLYLPVSVILTAYTLGRCRPQLRGCEWLLLAGVVAGALGRAHPGGDDNIRLPAYALLSLTASVGFIELCSRSDARRRALLAQAGLVLQVAMLWQPPSLYHPSRATERAFVRLRETLQRCAQGGSSVALDHTRLTGTPFVHLLALSDLVRNHDALAEQALQAVSLALDADTAPAALAESGMPAELGDVLARNYETCASLPALRLPTGFALAPTTVYRHKPRASEQRVDEGRNGGSRSQQKAADQQEHQHDRQQPPLLGDGQ